MKYLLLLLSIVSVHGANIGSHNLKINHCDQMITESAINKPLFFENFSIQKIGDAYSFFNYSEQDVKTIQLELKIGRIQDFLVLGESLWVLSDFNLFEIDKETGLISNIYQTSQGPFEKRYNARGFHHIDGHIVIAHAAYGIKFFNLKEREFIYEHKVNTQQSDGQKSLAVHVTGNSLDKIYILLTGSTQYGVHGVVSFNFNSKQIIQVSTYDRARSGVVFAYGKIHETKNYLYINNAGWIHQVDKIKLNDKIRPTWIAIKRVYDYERNLMIEGDFHFENNMIMGCAKVSNQDRSYTSVFVDRVIKQ